jgi:hypothetical protein
MFWRRFKISSIPLEDPKAFDIWLRNRWTEKDHYLEHFSRTGKFPAQKPWDMKSAENYLSRRMALPAAYTVSTELKPGNLREFMAIFAPITAFITALLLFYGASETVLLSPDLKTALLSQSDAIRDLITQKANPKAGSKPITTLPSSIPSMNGRIMALPQDDQSTKHIMDLATKLIDHPELSPRREVVPGSSRTKSRSISGHSSGDSPKMLINQLPKHEYKSSGSLVPVTKSSQGSESIRSFPSANTTSGGKSLSTVSDKAVQKGEPTGRSPIPPSSHQRFEPRQIKNAQPKQAKITKNEDIKPQVKNPRKIATNKSINSGSVVPPVAPSDSRSSRARPRKLGGALSVT